jgi:hypothetical protein
VTELSPDAPVPKRTQRRLYIGAVIVAICYGVFARWAFGVSNGDDAEARSRFSDLFVVMSMSFLFVVPFALGFVATYVAGLTRIWRAMLFPQLPALLALGVVMGLAWEGSICLIFWLPGYVVLTALGGLTAALVLRLSKAGTRRTIAGALVLLPYAVAPIEHQVELSPEVRHVETQIAIAADPATVWRNIAEVPAIQPSEQHFAWSHVIGFPRPIAATLTGTGVGSVRHASFERDVVFIERVTTWDENHALAFTIHANEGHVPSSALDSHVTVGGRYFDVLNGAYRIEPRPEGGVILHLSSDHRLSTSFNPYASRWTDFVMRDTQSYILDILKQRCESGR